MQYPHYFIYVDHRGTPAALIKSYLNNHPRIAKDFTLKLKNNFKPDALAVRKNSEASNDLEATWLVEFCITDMRAKLMNGQLRRELWGDPNGNYVTLAEKMNVRNIAVIGAEVYEPKVYQMLNSLMQEAKGIYCFLPTTPESAIEKFFELIRNPPPSTKDLTPNVRSGELGFGLSIATLIKGVTPSLGTELAEIWYDEISELEITEKVNEVMNRGKEPDKHRNFAGLSNKIYNMVHDTYLREKPKPNTD